jgi:hypothetical protein
LRTWTFLLHHGLMVLLLVAVGCGRKITPSVTTEVTDSTYVREVPRFISVNVPGDTVEVLKYIECDSVTNKPKPFELTKKGDRSSVKILVKSNGELQATGICDSLMPIVTAMDKEIYRLRHEKKHTTELVIQYKTHPYDNFCHWWTALTILALVAFGFYKLNKLFP